MATVLKTVIGASLSRVQIPAPPPFAHTDWLRAHGAPDRPQSTSVDALLDLACDLSPRVFGPARLRIYWWFLGRWFVLIGLLVIVAALDLRALDVPAEQWRLVLWIGMGILFISGLLAVSVRFSRSRTSLNQGRFHFVAREDGLTVEGPFGTQTVRWTAYKTAYHDRRFIYLMLSKRLGQVIPLSLVPDSRPLLDHLKRLGLLKRTPRSFFVF
jgi:hypothetical protein